MNRKARFICVFLLLIGTAHRLPAPISEESPTPAQEQSAKPKPKRTIKPKAESDNSESQAKTASPPQSKATRQQNLFDGIWRGTILVGLAGNHNLIFHVDGSGTVLTTNAHFGDWRKTLTPTCDGRTMTWNTTSIQIWTLTPNPDWQTALVTGTDPGSLFGFGAFNSSATFRKTSP